MTSIPAPPSPGVTQILELRAKRTAAHVYCVPVVRELPRQPEPGAGVLTW